MILKRNAYFSRKLLNIISRNKVFNEWKWFFNWLGKDSKKTLFFASIIGLFIGFSDLFVLWIFKGIFSESGFRLNIFLTFILITLNSLIRVYGSIFTLKSAAALTTRASQRVFNSTVKMKYENFDQNSSSFFVSRISYAGQLGDYLLLSFVSITSLIGSSLVVTIGALYLTGLKGASAVILTFIGYYFINKITRLNTLKSKDIAKKNSKEVIKLIQEAVLCGKEIRINESEQRVVNRYKQVDSLLRNANATNFSATSTTRYSVEGVGLIIISILIFISREEGIQTAVVMGLTFVRLLPALQGLFNLINNSAFYSYIFEGLRELDNIHKESKNYNSNWLKITKGSDYFVNLENVTYQYPKKKDWLGLNINFKLSKNDSVVITGSSGEGKSTLLDLICGLRKPKSGKIEANIESVNINSKNVNKIDYVYLGQNGKLFDSTILENIVDNKKLNNIRLSKIIKICSLKDVLDDCNNGLNTNVGEFGKEFSGGQVQRILLARALYSKKKIVILDEATSALDPHNALKIIDRINNFLLNENRSIVLVTHNISLVKYFKKHFMLEKGALTQVFK